MRADSKLVLDSSAWIEYFEGSGLGLKVRELTPELRQQLGCNDIWKWIGKIISEIPQKE